MTRAASLPRITSYNVCYTKLLRVALLSENRYEWAVTDLAILGLGAVTVPIYPTLTAHQIHSYNFV